MFGPGSFVQLIYRLGACSLSRPSSKVSSMWRTAHDQFRLRGVLVLLCLWRLCAHGWGWGLGVGRKGPPPPCTLPPPCTPPPPPPPQSPFALPSEPVLTVGTLWTQSGLRLYCDLPNAELAFSDVSTCMRKVHAMQPRTLITLLTPPCLHACVQAQYGATYFTPPVYVGAVSVLVHLCVLCACVHLCVCGGGYLDTRSRCTVRVRS